MRAATSSAIPVYSVPSAQRTRYTNHGRDTVFVVDTHTTVEASSHSVHGKRAGDSSSFAAFALRALDPLPHERAPVAALGQEAIVGLGCGLCAAGGEERPDLSALKHS